MASTLTEADARFLARYLLEEFHIKPKPRGAQPACRCGACNNCKVRINLQRRRLLRQLAELETQQAR